MYRKMRVYCKSIQQYQAERIRRRRVRELSEKGFTQDVIARQLGVSLKTIARDQHKLARYLRGQWNRQDRHDLESFIARVEALPSAERFELLTEAIVRNQEKPGKGTLYVFSYLNSRDANKTGNNGNDGKSGELKID